jgi:hypothetical protein
VDYFELDPGLPYIDLIATHRPSGGIRQVRSKLTSQVAAASKRKELASVRIPLQRKLRSCLAFSNQQ